MEYLKIDGEFPRLSGSAVTLGKFDGIHRGHRKLVERILEQKEKGLQTVLFSLGIGSQMIFTKEERCRILEDAGVDVLIECPLDARIRHMKADTFIKEILVGDLQAEHVAVGEDFRFGYERKGNPELLREMGKKLGFSVDVIPKEMEGKRKISSTFIREELKRGNMEKVNDLLGFPFFVDGVIEHGRGMGHKFLLPTTNIIPAKEKLMPPNGVYDTVSHFKDSESKVLHIGTLPFLSQYHLTSVIHSFCAAHPELSFSLKEVEDQDLLSGLEKNLFDLIFVRKHMLDLKLYTFHVLTEDRLVAVLPKNHPSASKKTVSLTELKRETFILMPPHTSIYRFCMRSFHDADIHPQILRTARAESIVSAVEIGEGISLLTESSFQLFRQPSLAAVPINGLEKLSVGVAHKKNMALTSSAECFLQYVKSHI